MVVINYNTREVSCKIVFYGPGLSGKTTNLQYIHSKVPGQTKGDLISLATDADRTLYFDFLPINIGDINGFATKFQLYTVPGQVFYNATRKLVLRGVDGLVFVGDSQRAKADENVESLNNLKENLKEYGFDLQSLPLVLQYNKRDLPDVMTVDELNELLNDGKWPVFEACATTGKGVFDTLKFVIKLVLDKAKKSPEAKAAASGNRVEDAQLPPDESVQAQRQEAPTAEVARDANEPASKPEAEVTPVTPQPIEEPTPAVQTNLAASAESSASPAPEPSAQSDTSELEAAAQAFGGAEESFEVQQSETAVAVEPEVEPVTSDSVTGTDRIPVVSANQVEEPPADLDDQIISNDQESLSDASQVPEIEPEKADVDDEIYKKIPELGVTPQDESDPETDESVEQDAFSVPTMQQSLRAKKKKSRFFLFRLFSRKG